MVVKYQMSGQSKLITAFCFFAYVVMNYNYSKC